jgi:hypothetical protein
MVYGLVVCYCDTRPAGLHVIPDALPIKYIKHHATQTYGGVEVWLHTFLISALHGGVWLASCAIHFIAKKRNPSKHWIGGWVVPIVDLDAVVKRDSSLLGNEPQ